MHKIFLINTLASLGAITCHTASAALIANGNLNTAVSQYSSSAGDNGYSLNSSTLNVLDGAADTGRNAGEWLWTALTRGFVYNSAGGAGGSGDGAFVNYVAGLTSNARPRAVAQFIQDSKVTVGSQTISLDVFMDDNTGSNALTFLVELYGWNNGQIGPTLSLGGANVNVATYNVTTLGDAVTILNTQVAAAGVADAAWETVELGTVNLGTGYDFYAWRIGVMGQTDGDDYALDNLAVSAIPEPSTGLLVGLFAAGSVFLRRRRWIN